MHSTYILVPVKLRDNGVPHAAFAPLKAVTAKSAGAESPIGLLAWHRGDDSNGKGDWY